MLALFACVVTTEKQAEAAWSCTGTHIDSDSPDPRLRDIDAVINNDSSSRATTFCVHAGTYTVSEVARLKAGDKLEGEPGAYTSVREATKPAPVVFLKGSGTDTLLSALGANISIKWVDLSGASGTGRGAGAIAAGSADSNFEVTYSRIHDNDCLGISNAKGKILHSEFFSNSKAGACIGVNGSAIKGITQFEAGNLYVHGEQGNGIWCDVGCKESAGDFYVHDSVVVGSGRAGIRYENSPTGAVIANNWIHGNGAAERRGGVDIRDSQKALVTGNVFGAATIDGKSYPVNKDKIAVRATDSGRTDRVNLWDVVIKNNDMNTEIIKGCELPDHIVACSFNQ
jgi:hypothetical protein